MDDQRARLERMAGPIGALGPAWGPLWERVVALAEEAHADQFRNNGRRYLDHALDVAEILVAWQVEPLIVMAGLLHDAVRYGRFASVAGLAARLEHADLASLLDVGDRLALQDSIIHYVRDNSRLQRIFDLMVEDVRAVLVRCANRLANLRDLDAFTGEQRDWLLLNTEEVYLPLLERLGLWKVRNEVDDRLFQARTPQRYNAILRWREQARAARAADLAVWQGRLQEALAAHGLAHATVQVEARTPAAIERHRVADLPRTVTDLSSLDGRHLFLTTILLPRVAESYLALAAVHECGAPSMASFRDYFAQPKDNGYAALHTSVIVNSEPFRVSLRTPALHELAGHGILTRAAYEAWQSGGLPADWQPAEQRALAHFVRSIRRRERDRLSVLTPRGDVVELPDGATVLDFAYSIHTEVGRRAGSAFVNAAQVPLNTELHSGDVVEIHKDLGRESPDPQWLDWVRTSKARDAIHLQLRQRPETRGRNLLDRELRQRGRKLADYEGRLARLAAQMGSSPDEIFRGVARGTLQARAIVDRLLFVTAPQRTTLFRVQLAPESEARFPLWHDELLVAAACCSPTPGVDVVGYHVARGVELHLAGCPHLLDPERCVALRWASERVEARLVPFTLRAVNRRGLIHDLTRAIRQANVDIVHLEGKRHGEMDEVNFTLEVTNELELGYLLDTLRSLPSVNQVLVDGREAEATIAELRPFLTPPQPILSPFSPGRPVAGSGHFWGRTAEVLTIETLLGGEHPPSLLVQGPRRIGKTSLLQHLRDSRALRERYRYVYVDLQSVAYSGVPSVLRLLARHLARAMDSERRVSVPALAELTEAPLDSFLAYLSDLTDAHRYSQKRILLALDEFGALVDSVQANALDARIFHMLRSVVQHHPLLTVLLCTSDDVADLLEQEGVLELLNVTPAVRLGHLDQEAAQQLIQEPLRGQLYFEPEAISTLLRVTDGHPYYLQILGANLITRLNNEQRRNVYESDIRGVVQRHLELNGSEFLHLWEREDVAQHAALLALCAPPAATPLYPFGPDVVSRRLRDAGRFLDHESLVAALDRLSHLDTLGRSLQADGTPRYHVRVELFREWFATHHPLRRRSAATHP